MTCKRCGGLIQIRDLLIKRIQELGADCRHGCLDPETVLTTIADVFMQAADGG